MHNKKYTTKSNCGGFTKDFFKKRAFSRKQNYISTQLDNIFKLSLSPVAIPLKIASEAIEGKQRRNKTCKTSADCMDDSNEKNRNKYPQCRSRSNTNDSFKCSSKVRLVTQPYNIVENENEIVLPTKKDGKGVHILLNIEKRDKLFSKFNKKDEDDEDDDGWFNTISSFQDLMKSDLFFIPLQKKRISNNSVYESAQSLITKKGEKLRQYKAVYNSKIVKEEMYRTLAEYVSTPYLSFEFDEDSIIEKKEYVVAGSSQLEIYGKLRKYELENNLESRTFVRGKKVGDAVLVITEKTTSTKDFVSKLKYDIDILVRYSNQ